MADLVYSIFSELTDKISAAGVADSKSNIYLGNRPKTIKDGLACCVVIDLPTEIQPTCHGNDEEDMQNLTDGIIYIYYKSKSNGTLNPKGLTDRVNVVRQLFPIIGKVCTCYRPRRMMSGYDGYGFHIASIAFRIRTNPINQ